MSLADFSKAYLEQKRNPDAPEAELKGFTAKDFKDFEAGIEYATRVPPPGSRTGLASGNELVG